MFCDVSLTNGLSECVGTEIMSASNKCIFRIFLTFHDRNYELYARQVGQADMYGFIEIEGLLFGERSSVVVDPAEEALRKEFCGVRKIMVPFQSIHRIDQVEKEGRAKIHSLTGGNGKLPPDAGGGLPPVNGSGFE